jgi:hypothetical protein
MTAAQNNSEAISERADVVVLVTDIDLPLREVPKAIGVLDKGPSERQGVLTGIAEIEDLTSNRVQDDLAGTCAVEVETGHERLRIMEAVWRRAVRNSVLGATEERYAKEHAPMVRRLDHVAPPLLLLRSPAGRRRHPGERTRAAADHGER